ncbi:MAG: TonB-dependent receptor [Proteobacteria bacterium]|nr:TonB-dependent receptor [Pseudomonadota bacterium]
MIRKLGSVGLGLLLLGGGFPAQAEDDTQIEEIVVTGSYIKRDSYDSPAPIQLIDTVDIEAAATPNLADIIFNQTNNFGTTVMSNPFADGNSASSNATSYNGGPQGGKGRPNLRGLGTRATMSLMDGKRVIFSDANAMYPQIALDRIELVLDSSSALYGSDAIAGAVNYIPLKRYEGVKLEVSRRDLLDVSHPDDTLSVLIGGASDKASGLFAVTHRTRDRIKQSEFPDFIQKSAASNSRNLVGRGFPGGFHVTSRDADGNHAGFAATRPNEFSDPGCEHSLMNDGEDATSPYHRRWGIDEGWRCRSDVSSILDYQTELEHTQLYTRFDYQLNDDVDLYLEGMAGFQEFNNRWMPAPLNANDRMNVHGDIAGNPFVAFIDRNGNGAIDANEKLRAQDNCNHVDCSSGDGFADRDFDGDGIADPAAQALWGVPQLLLSDTVDSDGDGIPDRMDDDAAGVNFSEDVRIANWSPFGKNIQSLPALIEDDGNSRRETKVDNFRLSGGIAIAIPDTTWSVDVAATWERRTDLHPMAIISPVNFSTPQLQEAMLCVNPADACTQFNPFSTSQFLVIDRVPQNTVTPDSDPAYNTPLEIDKLISKNPDELIEEVMMYDVVVTGTVYEGWAGPIQLAGGFHYSDLSFLITPSQLNGTQTNTFGAAIQGLDAAHEGFDVFAELSIPLLDGSGMVDFLGTAELQLAGRRTSNDVKATLGQVGEGSFDENVAKVALLWQPTDMLAVRVSYGEGFVVPYLTALFSTPSTATRQVLDPTCSAILSVLGVQLSSDYCDYNANGTAQSEQGVNTHTSGNPNMKPETSETVNIGFTLKLLEGDLTIDVDWLEAEIIGRPFAFNQTTLPAFEEFRFAQTLQGSSCADINCATQLRADWIANGEEVSRIARAGGNGRITDIFASQTNLLGQSIDTADINVRYRFDNPFGDYGRFVAGLQATYVDSYKFQTNPIAPTIEGAGKRNNQGLGSGADIPPLPELRVNLSLSWTYKNHYARLLARYHDEVEDLTASGGIKSQNSLGKVPSETYVDAYYSHTWEGLVEDGTTVVSLGIQNLFDTKPHILEDTGGVENLLDNPFGMIWTLQLSQEF